MTKRTVLWVDDRLYADWFREVQALREAFELIEADNLSDAVTLVKQHGPNLDGALLDLDVPGALPASLARYTQNEGFVAGYNGTALALFVRDSCKPIIPIVFITNYGRQNLPPPLEAIPVIAKGDPGTFGNELARLVFRELWSA